MCKVTRASLSDWLAFQARIRGFENPRLLRDRPSDGAAGVCRLGEGESCGYAILIFQMVGRDCYSSLRTIATSRAICSLRLSMEAKRSSLRSLREKATPSLRP